MGTVKIPVRWYGGAGYYKDQHDEDGNCYGDLELELDQELS